MKKWTIRIVIAGFILLVAAVVVVALCLDGVVKRGIETTGPQMTQVDVKLDGVHISLLSSSAHLKGLLIGNPKGYVTEFAIKVKNVKVSLKPMSVLSDKIIVKSIHIESPEITIEGGLKHNNLTKIQDNLNSPSSNEAGTTSKNSTDGSSGKKLEIGELFITDAKLHINNSLLGGKAVTVAIPDIHLTNLGADGNGITATELGRKVMHELLDKVIPATKEAVKEVSEKVVKNAKDASGKVDFKKMGDKLKSFFGQ